MNGSAVTFAADAAPAKVTGMTVVGAPVTVKYGALDLSGGPMTITQDGSIEFDYSAYDASTVYVTTDIPLTSDVDEDSTKVSLIAPTISYRTCSLVYDSGHYAMRITPDHVAGSEVYYKSGYFGKNARTGEEFSVVLGDETQTTVFPGDTVVIDGKSSQNPIYVGVLPDNVSAIRIDRATILSSGSDDNAMLDGATVTIGENGSLAIQYNDHAVKIGTVVLNGSTVTMDNNSGAISIAGSVTGTSSLTINGSVSVASGGSIANAIAGSGTISFASLPSSALTFSSWTGTVVLPSFSAVAANLNNYGISGSTVALTGITSGYIASTATAVLPALRLDGAVNITAMSQQAYTFAEISGTGDLSFASSNQQPISITITKVASDYSGTIANNTTATLTIGTLALPANTSTAAGTKLLSCTGEVTISTVKIGDETTSIKPLFDADGAEGPGFYIKKPKGFFIMMY